MRPIPIPLLTAREIIEGWEATYSQIYTRMTPFKRSGSATVYALTEVLARFGPQKRGDVYSLPRSANPDYLSRLNSGACRYRLRLVKVMDCLANRAVRLGNLSDERSSGTIPA